MSEEYVPCAVRQLPPPRRVEAARTAVEHNPANAPPVWESIPGPAPDAEQPPSPLRLALLTTKYWGARGVRLTVGFLDGPEPELRRKILAHMNAWGTRASVAFTETADADAAQVRIARTPGEGYWSYLGTDILLVPSPERTMNLDSFSLETPESEFFRVVRHETGHTLGFPHEHMRREIVQRLDPHRTVAYFGRTQGWTAAEVRQQVLTPVEEWQLKATPHADVLSIMCYALPASITKDRKPIPGGNDIDESDYALAAKLYPKL